METSKLYNPDLGTIVRCGLVIDKVHSCADCPIRRMAIKRPRSIFARLHAWHKTWWPGWNAYLSKSRSRL